MKENSIIIRRATPADAAALADLSRQLGYPSSVEQIARRLETILDSDEQVVWVACGDGEPVLGWIHIFLSRRVESDPFAEIGGFVVAEQHRGFGIGRLLLAAGEKWTVDNGITRLRVRSRINRPAAHNFYAHAGFSQKKEQVVFDKALKT